MRCLLFAAWACVLASALEEVSTEAAFKKTLSDNMAVVVDVRQLPPRRRTRRRLELNRLHACA